MSIVSGMAGLGASGSASPVTDEAWDAYNRRACGLQYLAGKMRGMETEAARLRDIIERALLQFFHDGSDGETAAKMLAILHEAGGARGRPIANPDAPAALPPATGSEIPAALAERLRLQAPERVRQDAEEPGQPETQVVIDDGPRAGHSVATCQDIADASLIVEAWNDFMRKPKTPNRVRSSEIVMLRRAELEMNCGIKDMRSLIDQLNGMQQIWARAADALKAAQHNVKLCGGAPTT